MITGNNGANNSVPRFNRLIADELDKLVESELKNLHASSFSYGLQDADQAPRGPKFGQSQLQSQSLSIGSPSKVKKIKSRDQVIENELALMEQVKKGQLNYKFFHEYLLKHLELIKSYSDTKASLLEKKPDSHDPQRQEFYKNYINKEIDRLKSEARKKTISFLLKQSGCFKDEIFFTQNFEQSSKMPMDNILNFQNEIIALNHSLRQFTGDHPDKKLAVLKLFFKEAELISKEKKSHIGYKKTPELDANPEPLQNNSQVRPDIIPGIKLRGCTSIYKSPNSRYR